MLNGKCRLGYVTQAFRMCLSLNSNFLKSNLKYQTQAYLEERGGKKKCRVKNIIQMCLILKK